MQKILILCVSGSLGTLARYFVGGWGQRLTGSGFPLGTVIVNITGSLLFGLCFGLFEKKTALPPEVKLFALSGFMGAYTTFSTYLFESATLMQEGQWLWGGLNIVGQTVLGLAAIVLGMALGRMV